jgi:uncharacterized membrane protein YdfJ with MMPL/SSD domain
MRERTAKQSLSDARDGVGQSRAQPPVEQGLLAALTAWTLRHRRLIAVFWLAAAVAGAAWASSATHALSQRSSLPGKPGFEANRLIGRLYGNGGAEAPLVAVLALPPGHRIDTPAARAAIVSAMRAVQARIPGTRIASYASTGNAQFLSTDRRTTFALIYPPSDASGETPIAGALAQMKRALARVNVGGSGFQVTGVDPLTTSGGGGGQGVLAETLIGAVGALAVLAFVFGSLLAFVPLLVAAVAIPTCFLLIWAITSVTQVFFIVQYLVALIGLGVAIDYSLLIVVRWREERSRGADNQEAVKRAMATAGHAVFFSGSTVAVALLALFALPVPFLRSVGYAGMLIPLISVAVALTLLPALLATLGPRLDWPHRRSDRRASRAWTRWGELVTRHRWPAALIALAVLAALIVPVFSLKLDNPAVNALGRSTAAHRALARLESAAIGPGALSPLRPLHGLRGLHPLPHPRTPRPRPTHQQRRRHRPRPHRPPRHQRSPHPLPRLPLPRLGTRDRGQDPRHRPRRRHPPRRHHHPRPPRPRPHHPPRPLELVAATTTRTPSPRAATNRRRTALGKARRTGWAFHTAAAFRRTVNGGELVSVPLPPATRRARPL